MPFITWREKHQKVMKYIFGRGSYYFIRENNKVVPSNLPFKAIDTICYLFQLLLSWRTTECPFLEPPRERFINELSEANHTNMARVGRLTDAVVLLTELDILSYIPYMDKV